MFLLSRGETNPKTAKRAVINGKEVAIVNDLLHLAPADVSGVMNVCASATPQCKELCLNTAGRGGFLPSIAEARAVKTIQLWANKQGFIEQLSEEIAHRKRYAKHNDMMYACRLNGTSDLPWLALAMAEEHKDVMFYDYTKHPKAWQRELDNYKLTFSRSESNAAECFEAMKHGINVAVVFDTRKGQDFPARFMGLPVVDGDTHDMRFLDPKRPDGKGLWVGLRAKGRAKKMKPCSTTGFVVESQEWM